MTEPRPQLLQIQSTNRDLAIQKAVDALNRGLLVVLPTDTVYGVGALPSNVRSVARLRSAKQRDGDKPIALLVADIEDVWAYGASFSNEAESIAKEFWPGALTLVLPVDEEFEGFRVPQSEFTRDLLRAAGGVLRVSSANLSGDPPATTAEAAVSALGSRVEIVLDDGPSPIGVASTVVKLVHGQVTMIREGIIKENQLKECLLNKRGAGES